MDSIIINAKFIFYLINIKFDLRVLNDGIPEREKL